MAAMMVAGCLALVVTGQHTRRSQHHDACVWAGQKGLLARLLKERTQAAYARHVRHWSAVCIRTGDQNSSDTSQWGQ